MLANVKMFYCSLASALLKSNPFCYYKAGLQQKMHISKLCFKLDTKRSSYEVLVSLKMKNN